MDLKNTRLSHGLTLQQVVNESGLARITVEHAEKGKAVTMVSAVRIVKALNILSGQAYTVEELGIQTSQRGKSDERSQTN
jgi:transcriptional regulator with XRE-family HTH domain